MTFIKRVLAGAPVWALIEWANAVFAALSGVRSPGATDTGSRALARLPAAVGSAAPRVLKSAGASRRAARRQRRRTRSGP